MRIKKLLATILTVALIGMFFVIPASAATANLTAGTLATSNGEATFTLKLTGGVSGAQGTFTVTGGSIVDGSASASAGMCSLNPATGDWIVAATGQESVTLTFKCKANGNSVTVAYVVTKASDKDRNDVTTDLGSAASGSATARVPATKPTNPPTKPTAPPTKPTTPPTKPTTPPTKPTTTTTTAASKAANLKALAVDGFALSPKFSENRTSYTITVPKDLTSLDVSALPLDSKAQVKITGDKNFTAGQSNTVKIEVKGVDGTTKVYTIRTVFEEESTEATPTVTKIDLTSLVIKAVTDVTPADFSPSVNEYTVTVPKGTNSLDVQALIGDVEGAAVTVVGADDLAANGNKVTITVTAADGTENVYTVNVLYQNGEPVPAPAPVEKSSGVSIWIVIIIALVLLILGLILGFIIGKKKGGNDGDDGNGGGAGFFFEGADDDDEDLEDEPSYSGFSFPSMSFNTNPPSMDDDIETAGFNMEVPEEPQPEAVPLNNPVYTDTLAAVAAAASVPPVNPVAEEPTPVVSAEPEEPVYVAPKLPYEPAATLTDENIVRPAPKPIAKNPFEQCAD